MARFFYFIMVLSLLCSCTKEKVKTKALNDFEGLMGNQLPAWKHVQTEEDFFNLQFFKQVYEKNIGELTKPQSLSKVPRVIHFIWIGPKAFPRESIENVRSWIAAHPGWKVKFWTDRTRPLPHPDMELCRVQDFPFRKLERCYHLSENYAEKSDLLRLEILYQEGGIYVDHDVVCLKSFQPLTQAFDLFCGMEVPYPTCLSSSVLPTNNLLGSKSSHPVIDRSIDWLVEKWDQIEIDYPGSDRDSLINRIAHRTFSTLGINFKAYANQGGNVDIALPSYYFNAPKADQAIYAQHQYKGTWFENESSFEKNTRQRLMMLSKKVNKLLLAIGGLATLNCVGWSLLFFALRQRTRGIG